MTETSCLVHRLEEFLIVALQLLDGSFQPSLLFHAQVLLFGLYPQLPCREYYLPDQPVFQVNQSSLSLHLYA